MKFVAWIHVNTLMVKSYIVGHATSYIFHKTLNKFWKKKNVTNGK
jgi:hypothetical protein